MIWRRAPWLAGASLLLVALAATVVASSDGRPGAAGAASLEGATHDHAAHEHSDPEQNGYDLTSHERSEGLVLVADEGASDRSSAG